MTKFAYYFNLSLEKSMEYGPAELSCTLPPDRISRDLTRLEFNLISLIELYLLITYGDMAAEEKTKKFNYFCIEFYKQAQAGKLGGYYAIALIAKNGIPDCLSPNLKSVESMLTKIAATSHPTPIVAKAAGELLELSYKSNAPLQLSKKLSEQAVRLGCITAPAQLGGMELKNNNFSRAIEYFNQAIANSYLHETSSSISIKTEILLAIRLYGLNSAEKIEYYFQLCADILKDMTHANRLEEGFMPIQLALTSLFRDENDRPEIINNWLTIDIKNPSLYTDEKYFFLFRRAKIDEAINQIINLVKETLEPIASPRPRCSIS